MTKGLRKSYQSRQGRQSTTVDAVRGLDLNVEEGEIFGLLGPNGAGKTTTMRMLATLIRPDGGDATVVGADLRTEPGEVRRRIGYVSQGGGTTDGATGREELVMQARMYGVGKAQARELAEAALGAFDLTGFADRTCQTYSGGQRRRVDLALGVIHRPKVLFLDEPTVGLDPQSRSQVWAEVRRLRERGMTVVLTTHYLDEADALCDRIAIVDHGELVAEGTPEDLKREISGDVLTIDFATPDGPGEGAGAAERAAPALTGLPFLRRLEPDERGGLRLYVDDGAAAIPQVLRELAAVGVQPAQVRLQRPSLDDVFLARTGRSLDGA
ncbi:ATP-binding cassette domain-containing protein [Kitasatospora nipponensis]|uniref:ATP-binding cassette domain-containing protein n=1 Tax=Kitasatospora nipponensis TaxID=258049 RepID=UPI0031DB04D5